MCKESVGKRRQFSLDARLRQESSRRCWLLREDSDQIFPQKQPFKLSDCHKAGLCVCTEHIDARFMVENLKRHMQHIFWKRKKIPSAARKYLENGVVFFEFRSSGVGRSGKPAKDDAGASSDSWEDCFRKSSGEQAEQELYFYIDHVNYSTWHFGALHMQKADSNAAATPLCLLEPCFDGATAGAGGSHIGRDGLYSDLEMFARLFDLNLKWSLRFRVMSSREIDWPLEAFSTVPTVLMPESEELVLWAGSLEESKRRSEFAKAKAAKLKQGKKRAHRKQGAVVPLRVKRRRRRPAGGVENEGDQGTDAIEDNQLATDDGEDENEVATPSDRGDGASFGSYEGDSLINDLQDGLGVDLVDETQAETGENGSGSDEDEAEAGGLQEPEDLWNELADEMALQEAPLRLSEPVETESAAARAEPAAAPALQAPAAVARNARAGGPRSSDNREVFNLPDDLGNIRFYFGSTNLVAFCPVHAGDCRRSATCEPKTARGSGRPLGMLVAWLQAASSFDSKMAHVSTCRPELERRQEARRFFLSLSGAREFAEAFEKQSPGGVDEEPARV